MGIFNFFVKTVGFSVPNTMTDLNLIIFFLDYTIILYLVGGPYVTEIKNRSEKRVSEVFRWYNINSTVKITLITGGSCASEYQTL